MDTGLGTRAGAVPAFAPDQPFPLRLETAIARKPASAAPAAAAATPLAAKPEARQSSPSADAVPLIATVRVNEQDKGEHTLYLVGRDEFLVPRAALSGWARMPADLPIVTMEGEAHVSLRSLPLARVRFDEMALELRIDFPPEAFAPQFFAYQESRRPPPTLTDDFSGVLNYQLGHGGSTGGGASSLSATLEASVHWREWLLRGQSFHVRTEERGSSVRGMTALTRDDPFGLTRLTLGDFTTGLTDLGGGVVLGGISFGRALDLNPYLVKQPTATFRTMVELPSQVDLYVGDARIYRQAVGPGPVELGNLSYLTGRRDVRVVVRDAFGREQELSFPFYFADRGLAPGLQEYSYGLGAIRGSIGSDSADYGALALAGAHRVGVNDWLTAGFQAEATRELASGGPSFVLRSDTLGILSLSALASRDRKSSRSGAAGSVIYSFQRGPFAAFLSARRSTRPFVSLASREGSGPPLEEQSASLSYSVTRLGTLSASWRDSHPRNEQATRSATLGYSVPIGRDWLFQATWRHNTGALSGREFFASVHYVASRDYTTFASIRDDGRTRSGSVQIGNLAPTGEGVGYRVAADVTTTPEGTTRVVSPELTYRSRYATVQANATSLSGAGAAGTGLYSVSVSGALAYVGGIVGLSRSIDDSFAVARIEPPAEGVRVYLNQQEMGRTDGSGTLFLPRLVSWVENHVAIDERDVPIDRSIEEKSRGLVPYARSGSVLAFKAPLLRSLSGSLKLWRDGMLVPLEFVLVSVLVQGKMVEMPTGREGDFYIENLPPGDYPASVEVQGRTCRFTLSIPHSDEANFRLPEATICNVP